VTSRRVKVHCVCEWPKRPKPPALPGFLCNGTGIQHCNGCGGDQCICVCGGERECPGCDACDATARDE
jgi:hypothetical protein